MVSKGCLRCGGDIYIENNLDGADIVCLQCGYRRMEEGYIAKKWRSRTSPSLLLDTKSLYADHK